jgi:hypothetical protein
MAVSTPLSARVKFARIVFRSAGIYGLLVLAPMYFLEKRIGTDRPPAITHPEFYYGFVGAAIAFQIAFLTIAGDPQRFRALIPAAMVEKFAYLAAVLALGAQGRVNTETMGFALIDGLLGVLFAVSYVRLKAGSEEFGKPDYERARILRAH